MKITAAESFVLKVPVGNAIADSMQFVTHLEFAGLKIATDADISGTGYTMTVGVGGTVIQKALDSLFIDDLLGKDPRNVREIWQQLYFGKPHWIGRAGATTMAPLFVATTWSPVPSRIAARTVRMVWLFASIDTTLPGGRASRLNASGIR
jgi:L-alanine-DL-glutamate epimerase-like enolase superfamily enzyme